jgi:methylated-DNA-[protein]-cysteine S-methyltransferase
MPGQRPGGIVTERTAPSVLATGTFSSPVGELQVTCSPAGVTEVSFGPPRQRSGQHRPRTEGPAAGAEEPAAGALLADTLAQLAEYFAGQRREFTVPVDWAGVTGTQRRVLQALLAAAPYGRTVTYGELARQAGLPDGGEPGGLRGAAPPDGYFPPARVVGQVMGANRCPVVVPCHRVVAGSSLGGYSGGAGVEIKRWLLTFEGALPPTLDWDPDGPHLG